MKRIILLIFILISTLCFSDTYNNISNTKFGYSTQYGYGFPNSTSTYSPGQQSYGARAPRRVKGYDSDGNPIDDGQGYGDQDSTKFWSWLDKGGKIYYYNGHWYMYNPISNRWNIWSENTSRPGHWNWHYRTSDPSYYNPFYPWQNPDDFGMTPSAPVPVGDIPFILFIGLVVLYLALKLKRRNVGLFIN